MADLHPNYDGTVLGMHSCFSEMTHRAKGERDMLSGPGMQPVQVLETSGASPMPVRRNKDSEIFSSSATPKHACAHEVDLLASWHGHRQSDITDGATWEMSMQMPAIQASDNRYRTTEATEYGVNLLGFNGDWQCAVGKPQDLSYVPPPRCAREFSARNDPPRPRVCTDEEERHDRPAVIYRLHHGEPLSDNRSTQVPASYGRQFSDVNSRFWRERGNPPELIPTSERTFQTGQT